MVYGLWFMVYGLWLWYFVFGVNRTPNLLLPAPCGAFDLAAYAEGGEVCSLLIGHTSRVHAVRVGSTSGAAASGSADGEVRSNTQTFRM